MASLTQTSRFISLILRHKPQVIGISLDEHGWADVQALIDGVNARGGHHLDRETLEEIVRTDDKQRYSFSEDGTRIRANQGHSVPVDVELEEALPPPLLYHGTGEKYVRSIDEKGLLPKARGGGHLSSDVESAIEVGERHGKPVVYTVDLVEELERNARTAAMAADGYTFYLSANHVWLTKAVPPRYLSKIQKED